MLVIGPESHRNPPASARTWRIPATAYNGVSDTVYDLHDLGWHSFQQLCLTIVREILGQTVESFLDSNDGGRDGAFAGTWSPTGMEDLKGRFVIQCKFTSKPNGTLQPSDLTDEFPKAEKLAMQGLCDVYVLMTNAGVSGESAKKITSALTAAGVGRVAIYGSDWIHQQIRENKRLRMLVPRVYGIGDLSQILDERAYAQARAIIDGLREDLSRVVVTDAYRKAAEALDGHGFVLLVGEPAAGKTTIASLLAMCAVDCWDAPMLKLDDPREVTSHWNPEEPRQFFWLDDAFGVTQMESALVYGWNRVLPKIQTMIRLGAKIVMTSRDYIYNQARRDLKEGAFPLLHESQVVIDAQKLTSDEKRQILYNHLKLGKQSQEYRHRIKPHLEAVAAHPRFIPEIARRLADPAFTKSLALQEYWLAQFVERREALLDDVLQGLDSNSRAALAVIYMRNDQLASPVELDEMETRAIERMGSSLGGCITALDSLRDSFVLHSWAGHDSAWRFRHPTIGDALARNVSKSPELLEIFIRGIAPDTLVKHVTCGDVGLENAVIIPQSLYCLVMSKLDSFTQSTAFKSQFLPAWHARWTVGMFLAHRCDKEFLESYIAQHGDLLQRVVTPAVPLSWNSDAILAVRLHEFGLLPEEARAAFVATITASAVSGEDLWGLDSGAVRAIFKDAEFGKMLQDVRAELLPALGEVRLNRQREWTGDDSAVEHMQPLLESMETLLAHFGDCPDDRALIEKQAMIAHEWAWENMPEEQAPTPHVSELDDVPQMPNNSRSIFDDVDT